MVLLGTYAAIKNYGPHASQDSWTSCLCTAGLCELPHGKARCEVISYREAFLISWFELVLTEGYMLVWWRNKGSDS